MSWEMDIDVYTLVYIRRITTKDPVYGTGNPLDILQ